MIRVKHKSGKMACAIHATNGSIEAVEIKLGDCTTIVHINSSGGFWIEKIEYPLRE